MPYAGITLKPRVMADHLFRVWQNRDERHKALATALGESKLSVGAWHDNENDTTASRDCGLFQINIPGFAIGTESEAKLRTESLDPEVYEPVIAYNIKRARDLYDSPMHRDGEYVMDKRYWQPWVAYTSGWCSFPEWWVWRQVEGEPVGPWVATGRYIHKAVVGWANWHLLIREDKSGEDALAFAKKNQAHWKIKGELALHPERGVFFKSFPAKPQAPPEDGVGPRPVPNDGR